MLLTNWNARKANDQEHSLSLHAWKGRILWCNSQFEAEGLDCLWEAGPY